MAKQTYKVTVISPMFLNGADSKLPELRAASVRGHLRYWLRAYLGAGTGDLKDVWEGESAVFGSTDRGSAVWVRVYDDDNTLKIKKSPMLPHRQDRQSPQDAIQPEGSFTLELMTRPGIPMPEDAHTALHLWALFGGLGKRSRRMFGAFSIKATEGDDLDTTTEDGYQAALKGIRESLKSKSESYTPTGIPRFSTLHRGHTLILIGNDSIADPTEANRALFKLLRSDKFRSDSNFGSAKPRRSSTLIAQVRRFGRENYRPVLTAMRAHPDAKINWDKVKEFMDDAKKEFNCAKVYGSW